ncbi:putative RNA polymerase II Elongator complex associated protein Kti12 [Talaromyces proteolyticus]|uniref:RNA polymerase II Elongator complex associated protein Kti12 n=1 Tax=Talaromyces proteolyticus TaxID=1131652 RepID=A0AAD4KNT8_9EURO|nr:putative RNA polymerase II Elongator complex associated protein Kti12 [Talaromyces proteolyticus]KAH8694973.1 putative RNA polymerase II Elongator complex associated protein Kti12 [Talaromyces proteolyticus]
MLTGYPCSGLSYRAKQLAELLESTQNQVLGMVDDNNNNETHDNENKTTNGNSTSPQKQKRFTFHIVPSHDPSHPRTVYDHARTEKEARAVAFARVKRALAKDAFVILDGMNYIKGYRYQLWCEAKAVGTTCCVVHVGTPIDKCVAINNARLRRRQETGQLPKTSDTTDDLATPDDEEPYPADLHNNLIFRYEEPIMHSRWDKPLFTVPWSDAAPPVGEIWTATTGIPVETAGTPAPEPNPLTAMLSRDPNSSNTAIPPLPSDTASVAFTTATTAGRSGRLGRPKITPHLATIQPAQSEPGALYGFEKRISAIVTAIRNFTQANPSAEEALAQQLRNQTTYYANDNNVGITIPVPNASTPVFVPAHIARSATTDDLASAGGILALPRLQRLRRQWITMNRSYIGMNHNQGKSGLSVDQVGDAFVRFLNNELAGDATS